METKKLAKEKINQLCNIKCSLHQTEKEIRKLRIATEELTFLTYLTSIERLIIKENYHKLNKLQARKIVLEKKESEIFNTLASLIS